MGPSGVMGHDLVSRPSGSGPGLGDLATIAEESRKLIGSKKLMS